MENLFADIRYGARLLLQKPGITFVALTTLALGVGANTAIFSVVNGVVLRPLPYEEPEELVMVWQDHSRIEGPATEWASPDNFFDWRDENEVFEGTFAISGWTPTIGYPEPEQVQGALTSHDAFSLLGIEPVLGRSFRPEEDAPSEPLVVLLSHSLWQRRFGADRDVVGKALTVGDTKATVIGVLAPDTDFPLMRDAEIFAPLQIDRSNSCGRNCMTLRVIARLKEDVPLERARADMDAIASRLEREFSEANSGIGINLVPLHDQVVGGTRPALFVLLGAVALVLLIACANVSGLMLARAADREKEMATRMAMGASRSRILKQLLTESLMLSFTGGALGVVIALWGIDVLLSLVPGSFPRLDEVTVDGAVLAFTLFAAVATGFLFGLAPALRSSRPDLHRSLKEGARGSTIGGAHRFRSVLVVTEVALALALLVGASLLLSSFAALTHVDPGFDPRGVLTGGLDLSRSAYDEAPSRIAVIHRLLERVRALPGVEGAGAVFPLPMGGADADAGFLIEGREPPEPKKRPVAWYRSASPDYFSAMKMRLSRGRWFLASDDAEAPPVVLINETAARRYWPADDPLLSRVRIGGAWRQVVGIVADTRHFGLGLDDRPALYFPYDQIPLRAMSLVVRTTSDPAALAAPLREVVSEIDPEMALGSVLPMEDIVSATVSAPRITTVLFTLFAACALTLAAIGLYGILSYTVTQRIHEIGIRMALGARGGDVLRATVGHGMLLLGIGVAAGLLFAFFASRLLASMLFGVSPMNPGSFFAAALVLAPVALTACYLPARRASRVDPIVALRYE